MNRKARKPKIMAEINITPFTDVVLVLLIIFMIATPFIYQSSMNVQLPQASTLRRDHPGCHRHHQRQRGSLSG